MAVYLLRTGQYLTPEGAPAGAIDYEMSDAPAVIYTSNAGVYGSPPAQPNNYGGQPNYGGPPAQQNYSPQPGRAPAYTEKV